MKNADDMKYTVMIICCLALTAVVLLYRWARMRKAAAMTAEDAPEPGKPTVDDLLSACLRGLSAEKVERLTLADAAGYFRSLKLTKGKDTPFVAKVAKEQATAYLLATLSEEAGRIENGKLIVPEAIDEELSKAIGDQKLIVLS